jgi:hypothetical protein
LPEPFAPAYALDFQIAVEYPGSVRGLARRCQDRSRGHRLAHNNSGYPKEKSMSKKFFPLYIVLVVLVLASLACATVTGSGVDNVDDLDATAQSVEDTVEATAEAAEATAEAALNGDDSGDDSGDDTGDADATDTGDDTADDSGEDSGGDFEFAADGPDNVPMIAAESDDTIEILFADPANLSYYTDAEFDATVDFYREAMPALGWELSPNGDTVFGEIASLQYEQGSDTAIIAITADPISGRRLVVITIQ